MKRILAVLAATCGLWGCDALKADKSTLWSTSSAPMERPRCDACHGFAPRNGAHRYHLDTTKTTGEIDHHMTCFDCHSASIAFSRTPVLDSIYYSADFDVQSTHTAGYPWQSFIRGADPDVIISLDSVPLRSAEREPSQENPFWITAEAKRPGMPGHANGSVDVVFAERWSNSPDGNGKPIKASWDPVRLSCNAVACHGEPFNTAKYTWKDVVKATP